jgi:hypothetical protein
MTAFSMYLQLPSIAGGCPAIHNPRTHHPTVTGDLPNMEISKKYIILETGSVSIFR